MVAIITIKQDLVHHVQVITWQMTQTAQKQQQYRMY